MIPKLENIKQEPEVMMMEAEVTYKTDTAAQTVPPPLKQHENKKYRLRPINWSKETDIYKKYFRPRAAKWISWIQVTIGFATLAAEIMKMIISREQSVNSMILIHTIGSWSLSVLAAGVTVMAAYRATYCRLHLAMGLHIINTITQYLLVEKIFRSEIPNIRKHLLQEIQEYSVIDHDIAFLECLNNGYNCTYWKQMDNQNFNALTTFYRIELSIAGIISIYGILQIILSFLMTLMTGRALCCGRISLERKFYEIENIDRPPHNRPVVMTLPDNNEIQNQKLQQRKESENSDASFTSPCQSPPPYDSASATTTPRSSEDVAIMVTTSNNDYEDANQIHNSATLSEKKEIA